MSDEDVQLKIAKINLRQGVIVAAITGVLSIISTLIITGNLSFKEPDNTSKGGNIQASGQIIRSAPEIYVSSQTLGSTLDDCMKKAEKALGSKEFSGQGRGDFIAWGYRDDYVGALWCHTDKDIVVFLAAGPKYDGAAAVANAMRQAF